MVEGGLLTRWKKKHWFDTAQCDGSTVRAFQKEVTLKDVTGVFYILCVTAPLWACVLGAEALAKYVKVGKAMLSSRRRKVSYVLPTIKEGMPKLPKQPNKTTDITTQEEHSTEQTFKRSHAFRRKKALTKRHTK